MESKVDNQKKGLKNLPNRGKLFKLSLILVTLLVILGYTFFTVKGSFDRFMAAKDEINFAYNHPAIVRVVETKYASQSAQLEMSFEKQPDATPSPQDQLIKELTQQLQTSK